MKNPITINVDKASPNAFVAGCRVGTLTMPEGKLRKLIGNPTRYGSPDSKVTKTWVFTSPRGEFEIRDYWWNAKGEWSIAAANAKAALWGRAFGRYLTNFSEE